MKDVEVSSEWYQSVFDCKSMHGGSEFDILTTENNEVFLCLHKWGEHDHPSMQSAGNSNGNGLILYFRTENLDRIRENLRKMDYDVEKEIELNPNSHKMEFSLRDPDGYYITIAEYHTYKG